MATVTPKKDVNLAWDAFLDREADKARLPSPEARERLLASARAHIDGFRKTEWVNIKKQLSQEYSWEVPDGLEPHWVGPGKAVLWQEQIVRQSVQKEDGTRELIEVNNGWEPTNSGVSANNASVLAGYLRKGLRFRPPVDGVSVEVSESAALSEAPTTEEEDTRTQYKCKRHGRGLMAFVTWKGYLRHCDRYNEVPEEKPPQEVLDRMASFPYYCYLHNKGFKQEVNAVRHIRTEMRKPGKFAHPNIKDMEVKQNGNPNNERPKHN